MASRAIFGKIRDGPAPFDPMKSMRPIFVFSLVLVAACNGRVLDVGSQGPQPSGGTSGGPTVSGPGGGGGTAGGSGGPQVGIAGGSGYFTVTSDGAVGSYEASVVFTSGWYDPSAFQSIGACQINPTYIEPVNDHSGIVGAPRPQAGAVYIDGGFLGLEFHPIANGDYPAQNGNTLAWGGGESIIIKWPGGAGVSSGLEAGVSHVFKAPTYAHLDPKSALSDKTPKLSILGDDLTLIWHFDSQPAADDKIVLELRIAAGSEYWHRAVCAFDASAGQGIVPADAIMQLGRGTGTYAVTSEHDFSTVLGYEWHLNYKLASYVSDATGTATNSVVISD
jgi:hypothetical protein